MHASQVIKIRTICHTCLLKTGVGSGDAGAGTADGDGEIRSETNVSTGHDAELEDLGPGPLALGNASGDGTLVKGRRRLEVGRSGLPTGHAKCRGGRCRQSRLGGEAGLAEGVAALSGQEAEAKDRDDTHVLGWVVFELEFLQVVRKICAVELTWTAQTSRSFAAHALSSRQGGKKA